MKKFTKLFLLSGFVTAGVFSCIYSFYKKRPSHGAVPPEALRRSYKEVAEERSIKEKATFGGGCPSCAGCGKVHPSGTHARGKGDYPFLKLSQDWFERTSAIEEGGHFEITLPDKSILKAEVVDRFFDKLTGRATGVQGYINGSKEDIFYFAKHRTADGKVEFDGHIIQQNSELAFTLEASEEDAGSPRLVQKPADEVYCRNVNFAAGGNELSLLEQRIVEKNKQYNGHTTNLHIPAYQQGVPPLESMPSSKAVIYLDFDGDEGPIPGWPGRSFSPSNFNKDEIRTVWATVAEDYSIFTINVTTDKRVYEAAPANSRGRCIIFPGSQYGISPVGNFSNYSNVPALVQSYSQYQAGATISHEIGHQLRLGHATARDGYEYYYGHGSGRASWAPIMGVAIYSSLSTWSNRDYRPGGLVDEIAIIAGNNQVAMRSDDHGDSFATATHLNIFNGTNFKNTGLIETRDDYDSFKFTLLDAGDVKFNLSGVWAAGYNIDVQLELYDAQGTLIETANGGDVISTSLQRSLPAGDYYVSVTGAGRGDPLGSGYSDYAMRGNFTLTGTVTNARLTQRFPIDEEVPNGTSVGVVVPENDHGDAKPVFSFSAGNEDGIFAINPLTGEITVADNTLLDFDKLVDYRDDRLEFELTVAVDNSDDLLDEAIRVVIPVNDTNSVHVLSISDLMPVVPADSIAVGSVVGLINVSDSDKNNTAYNFSITSGNDQSYFSVNASGQVKLIKALPKNLTTSSLTIEVADDEHTVTTVLKLDYLYDLDLDGVYDEHELLLGFDPADASSLPQVVSVDFQPTVVPAAALPSASVGQPLHVGAFWNAAEGMMMPVSTKVPAVFYNVMKAVDGVTTGLMLRVKGKHSFSKSSSAQSDDFKLLAYDYLTFKEGDLDDTIELTIYGADANSKLLVAVFGKNVNVSAGGEQKSIGGSFGFVRLDSVTTDAAGTAVLTFDSDKASGVISGLQVMGTFTEQPEVAPYSFDSSHFVNELQKINVPLFTVKAADRNPDSVLTYTITSGNEAGIFALDGKTGELSLTTSLDYETQTSYVLDIQVKDETNRLTSFTVTISVVDSLDDDFDGYLDSYEIFVGTDHENAQSKPLLVSLDFQGDGTTGFASQIADPKTMSGPESQFKLGKIWNACEGTARFSKDSSSAVRNPSFSKLLYSEGQLSPVSLEIKGKVTFWSGTGSAGESHAVDRMELRRYGADSTVAFTVKGLIPNRNYSLLFMGRNRIICNGVTKSMETTHKARFDLTADGDGFIKGQINASSKHQANLYAMHILGKIEQKENLPPVVSDESWSISENNSAGFKVGQLRASDPEGGVCNYSITAGDDVLFSVTAKGEIIAEAPLDYEKVKQYKLTVRISDTGLPIGFADAAVTINVTDVVNDDTDGDGLIDEDEITYFGDTTSQTGADDPDRDGLTNAEEIAKGSDPLFSKIQAGDVFQINFTNSSLPASGHDNWNYYKSVNSGHNLTSGNAEEMINSMGVFRTGVRLTASGWGGSDVSNHNWSGHGVERGGPKPQGGFWALGKAQTGAFWWGGADYTEVITLHGLDDSLKYTVKCYHLHSGVTNPYTHTITAGGMSKGPYTRVKLFKSPTALFHFDRIQSTNGEIKVSSNASNPLLNLMTVEVTPGELPPEIDDTSVLLAEKGPGGEWVATLTATDRDLNETLTFSISSGNDAGLFTVSSDGTVTTTGVSSFAAGQQYQLGVTVTDSKGLTDTATLTVTITVEDFDNDGLSDYWERLHFGDIKTQVGSDKSINSGLTLKQKHDLGLDPKLTDTDKDGYDDYVEILEGSDPLDPASVSTNAQNIAPRLSVTVPGAFKDFSRSFVSGKMSHTEVYNGAGITITGWKGNTQKPLRTNRSIFGTGSSHSYKAPNFIKVVFDRSVYFHTLGFGSWNGGEVLQISGDAVALWNSVTKAGGRTYVHDPVAKTFQSHGGSGKATPVIDSVTGKGVLVPGGTALHITFLNGNAGLSELGFDPAYIVNENSAAGTVIGKIDATDVNVNDKLSYSIASGNDLGYFAIDDSGEVTVASPIDYGVGDTHTLTLRVTDLGGLSTDTVFIVTVENDPADNDAPTVADATVALDENGVVGETVMTVSASDPDSGDLLSYSITAGNNDGLFSIDAKGKISTTGPLDFETVSQHLLTVEVSDGKLKDSATVTVNVNNVNEAPVAGDDSAETEEDVPVTINVLNNDTDVDSAISVSAVTQGANGTVSTNGTTIVYTPSAGYNGADSFTYTVTDGQLTDTATVSVTVHTAALSTAGKMVTFDGSSAYSVTNTRFNPANLSAVSLTCWVNVDRTNSLPGCLFSIRSSSGERFSAVASDEFNQAWAPRVDIGKGTAPDVDMQDMLIRTPNASVTLCNVFRQNVPSYLAATFTASEIKVYINGFLIYTSNFGMGATDAGKFSIGENGRGGERLVGAMDEVALWDNVLSLEQIQEHQHRALTGAETDLILAYNFDNGSALNLVGTAEFDGTAAGTPAFSDSTALLSALPLVKAGGLWLKTDTGCALDGLSVTTAKEVQFDNRGLIYGVKSTDNLTGSSSADLPASGVALRLAKVWTVEEIAVNMTDVTVAFSQGDFDLKAADSANYQLLYRAKPSDSFTVVKIVKAADALKALGGLKFSSLDITSGEYTLGVSQVYTAAYGFDILIRDGYVSWTVEDELNVAYYELILDGKVFGDRVYAGENYKVQLPEKYNELVIKVVDYSGLEQLFSPSLDSQFISIEKGWNLLSLPLSDASIKTLKELTDGPFWIWRDGRYIMTDSLSVQQGFWLYAREKRSVNIVGHLADGKVNLEAGWNMTGPAENCKRPEGMTVYGYSKTYQKVLDIEHGMISGQGYWIFSEQPKAVILK